MVNHNDFLGSFQQSSLATTASHFQDITLVFCDDPDDLEDDRQRDGRVLWSLAFGKRVSRRGREKRDSEEVRLHNFVYLGGVVHDMRKLWRPYSQSYFWAEPPKIMVGQGIVSTT